MWITPNPMKRTLAAAALPVAAVASVTSVAKPQSVTAVIVSSRGRRN
jgi:hypothetical protein